MKVKVGVGQTLVDIAVQYLGDATAFYELAQLNNLNITDDLIAGQLIELPEVSDEKVVAYFERENLYPAYFDAVPLEGIGSWEIENNFIVS